MKAITLGVEQLEVFLKKKANKARLGILCHPSSATRHFEHIQKICDAKGNLTTLFGPQHGIHGETQDNMIEWQDSKDEKGRPVFSLYGERRKPTAESLNNIDFMIVDLFDVGARYYTFIYTMSYMMQACAQKKIPVIICDRPNPIGGKTIEGPYLNLNFKSFVGLYRIPICHGLTIGELALRFAEEMDPKPELHILKMRGWKRAMHFPETGQPWTLPSPNMPMYETSVVYPGMCLLEATTLSEGRGTTRPFELIGAPFFEWDKIEEEYSRICKKLKLQPASFHRQGFIPTFHKFSGQLCRGALQFVKSPATFQPVRHMTVLLWIFRRLYGSQWAWTKPPYEYEYVKPPIDILAGGPELRECVDSGSDLKALFSSWKKDEEDFKKARKKFLLY